MTTAPHPRTEFLVIEGGRGRAVERLTSSPVLAPEAPTPKVIDLAQVRAQARPELSQSSPCEPKPHWCVGMAAVTVFLVGLGLWTLGATWIGEAVILP